MSRYSSLTFSMFGMLIFQELGHLKIMADSKSALRMAIPKVYSLQPMKLLKYSNQIFVDWRP